MPLTIADLDRRIKNLTLIRELASDPECLALMRELAAEPASQAPKSAVESPTPISVYTGADDDKRRGTGKGALKSAVIATIQSMNGGAFTVYDLEKKMSEGGYLFNAAAPAIAIAGVVRKLVQEGHGVEVQQHGAGSAPTYYRRKHAEGSA